MVNILMVNKLFHPYIGGIEITVTQLCEHLANDENFNVSVLAGNENRFGQSKLYKWKNANIYKLFSLGVLFSTPIALSYPMALKRLIKKNDVFHFHVPNPMGELAFFLNKIPSHKKVIITVHADVWHTKKKIFAPVYNHILKKMLDRADIITTSAPQNAINFPILKNYLDKCITVPLAYDAQHVRPVEAIKKEAFKNEFGIKDPNKIILFVGRLVYYKGLSFLIDAIKTLTGVQLIIVGHGNYKKLLIEQVENLKLNNIVFTGELSDEQLATAYSVANIFVLPSIKKAETFGIVQAEAMAYGLSIINTNLSTGVNFVSIDNETGVTVPLGDSNALREAINKIISNENLSKKFSENALKRSALFSPENMVSAFKKLYLQ